MGKTLADQMLNSYQFRFATKLFDKEKKIADEDFKVILEAGRMSPSSFGVEPWYFLVVQSPELREKLKATGMGIARQISTASHFVIILARRGTQVAGDSEYIKHMGQDVKHMPDEAFKGFVQIYNGLHKGYGRIGDEKAMYDWALRQTYIALGNMLNAAALLEIDSCAMEGFDVPAVEKILVEEGLMGPEKFGVAVMAAFGYREEGPEFPKARQGADEVIAFV